ncbi:MAG TPA: rhomboid family intramembrane serine protease [Candidatus Binataceae bacterium]|nr:rhomboid family intramembrane serine protease [Candidatus Binataceae bacterium]
MIPLRDNAAKRRLTPINSLLIVINVAVFAYEVSLGPQVEAFVRRYAMVPLRITDSLRMPMVADLPAALVRSVEPILTIFTAMFVHGGVLHVVGNMLYLFIFGAAVEWRLGSIRFLFFYFASGVAAAIATILIAPQSGVPVIGASGAIAGVLGAYFIFYPRGRITTILPLFIYIQIIEVPAVLYLLLWFALQLYSGLAEGTPSTVAGGVAWWAHIGGFLFGLALAPLLARREAFRGRSR